MSANNYILIDRYMGKYRIRELDEDSHLLYGVIQCNTLEEACLRAENICSNQDIEYGIRFNLEHKIDKNTTTKL